MENKNVSAILKSFADWKNNSSPDCLTDDLETIENAVLKYSSTDYKNRFLNVKRDIKAYYEATNPRSIQKEIRLLCTKKYDPTNRRSIDQKINQVYSKFTRLKKCYSIQEKKQSLISQLNSYKENYENFTSLRYSEFFTENEYSKYTFL